MAVRPHPRLTYEDYVAFPDDGQRHELIDGEHFVTPAPNMRHQRIARRLSSAIDTHLSKHGGGEVFFAPCDVVLSKHDIVQPDLLFVADDRAEVVTEANVWGAPSLAIEVVSNPRRDRKLKRDLYERAGIPEYWIVDPDADRVDIYRLAGEGYGKPTILEPGDVLTTALIPGLEIDLTDLFRS